jgi:NADPH:quinone reductase-like Zn-dependent oxidoreductase
MRAALVSRYGPPDAVTVSGVPTPVPGAGEVLVRVAAAAVTAGDARLRSGRFPAGFGLLVRLAMGLRGPRRRILGAAFCGTVVEAGPQVTGVRVGDEVAGMTGMRMGAHAEYVSVPATCLVAKPAEVGHAEAAGILFGGTTALHFLRDRAAVRPGARVLVNGASGAVGSSAVQLATYLGGVVTAVTSAKNTALVSRLGAAEAIDYTSSPLSTLDGPYDVVFDAVGNLSRADGLRLLAPNGRLVLAVASLLDTLRASGRVVAGAAPERPEDMALLLGLVAEGRLDPVTESLGGLESLPDAYRRIDSGRKVGNLVVLPAES